MAAVRSSTEASRASTSPSSSRNRASWLPTQRSNASRSIWRSSAARWTSLAAETRGWVSLATA
ncbi:hypothetical protein ACFQH6_18505 [Halobacteriaceae archaeon GCM10025711]